MKKFASVAAYLRAMPPGPRAALLKLRKTIKAAAPEATEGISYGIAGFNYKGKRLVYFGYAKAHYALYGGGKGTVRFPADKPLPDRLVTKIVQDRLAQVDKA